MTYFLPRDERHVRDIRFIAGWNLFSRAPSSQRAGASIRATTLWVNLTNPSKALPHAQRTSLPTGRSDELCAFPSAFGSLSSGSVHRILLFWLGSALIAGAAP